MSVVGASEERFNHGGLAETHLQQSRGPLLLRSFLQLRFRCVSPSCNGCDYYVWEHQCQEKRGKAYLSGLRSAEMDRTNQFQNIVFPFQILQGLAKSNQSVVKAVWWLRLWMRRMGNTENPILPHRKHGPGGQALLTKFSTYFYSTRWCYHPVINATCSLLQLLLQKAQIIPLWATWSGTK